jgi:hypothetical protein
VSIVVSHEAVDFLDQVAHDTEERAAADRAVDDEREPGLHLIEPTRVGGGVMEVEARMAGEPGLDPRMLVSGVVIGDQVRLKFGGNVVIEMIEKGQELLVPMARFALGDDRPRRAR